MDLKELEAWFQGRPRWLQDAARRLVQNGNLTDQDYDALHDICLKEATGQIATFAGIPAGALNVQETAKSLRLDSIRDVRGINALSPSKPLEFGKEPLCIVYGRNGAGKSGYVRLLKHACGARRPGDLLCNIFASVTQPQSAKLTFTEGANVCPPRDWTGKPIPELQGVEIYDTASGLVYVNEENEVAFEPWILRLFTQLTDACTTLSKRFQTQIAGLVSKKAVLPIEFQATTSAQWYANLAATTNSKEVDDKTAWTPEREADLVETAKRLAEANPATKAETLRAQRGVLLKLLNDLKERFEGLADERCSEYLQIKADAAAKRKTADEDANKIFEQAPLAGIGSDSWQLLWEAARKYSEEQAYIGVAFPNVADNARCVLCQQTLDQESRDRFVSFEDFVKGELQRLATEAEKRLQTTADSFAEVPTIEEITLRLQAIGIVEDSFRLMVTTFAAALATRRQTCLAAENMADVSLLPTYDLLNRLKESASEIEKQAIACDEDAKGQNRPELERKAKEFSARKWLSQQRKGIDEEIKRLKLIRILEEMDRLTNTQALSTRKAKLTDELITTAYVDRFRDELKRLKASELRVELKKTRSQVGHVYHRITIQNAALHLKTTDILSEGEFRIVSLAAFLADTEGRGGKTTFIFDDPISSLDHVYEDATAKRLVELSQIRQVVVFTHRLSLVGFLKKYADKYKLKPALVCLSRYRVGDITDLPIDLKNTQAAAKGLANERLEAAKKALASGDVAYEIEARGLCGDIRNLLERIVERDLINEVVKRFSPEVNTKGKIHALARITEDDCKFIDEYMTKYSVFEHSQPEDTPVALPKPGEIEADLTAIIEFIGRIRQRNAQ